MRSPLAVWTTALSILSFAGLARAGHDFDYLERLTDQIEDRVDSLEDLLDDRFDNAPDYPLIERTVHRLDSQAEQLEDAIDDGDCACARPLVQQMLSNLGLLQSVIAEQQPCHVSPAAIDRALRLAGQIQEGLLETDAGLSAQQVPVLSSYPPSPVWSPGISFSIQSQYQVRRPVWGGFNPGYVTPPSACRQPSFQHQHGSFGHGDGGHGHQQGNFRGPNGGFNGGRGPDLSQPILNRMGLIPRR